METKFLDQITELLELEEKATMDDVFRDYPIWDSLAYLSTISFVDSEYGLVIPRDEFGKLKTIGDIWAYVQSNKDE